MKINATMSMKQIQAILDKGGDITFAPGTYNITQTLYLSNNSQITCEKDVVFVKKCLPSAFMTKVTSETIKYKGVHNVTWIGGIVISEIKSKNQSNLFTIVHAKNIIIQDLKVKKSNAQHNVEINSSKSVYIKNCSFYDHNPPKPHKECVQIDFASYSGLTYAKANDPTYDGTHCEEVYVIDCYFSNISHAIGTHTCTHENKSHKCIAILNNKYVGKGDKEGIFLKCLNMQDVFVNGNQVTNVNTMIKFNTIKTETLPHGGTVKVDKGKPNKDIYVENNRLDNFNHEIILV